MSKTGIFIPALLIMVLTIGQGFGQTREELEQNKLVIEREIRLINQMLNETKRSAEISLNHLVMLNSQINSRETLLRTIGNEIRLIERRIRTFEGNIATLEKELETLREAYAEMIRQAYRTKDGTQLLMFLFASSDFNQAMLRLRHMQQYARHRQIQAEKILATQQELNEKIAELRVQRVEQQELLARQREELASLSREKAAQDQTVNQLRRRERELLQRLRQQEQASRELQRAIERVIAEERRRAQEQARAEGRPVTDMFALTPEERQLSNNFAENRGKLLWPVERGIITGKFGEQPHPVLRNIKTNNSGIDISTVEGARARSIFDGTVSRVISIPGGNYAVIVRHGEYLTVYSNLSEVFVANNQKVSIRQDLGVIATDPRDAKTFVNLQVWKGNDKLNPEQWIARQR